MGNVLKPVEIYFLQKFRRKEEEPQHLVANRKKNYFET